MSCDPEIEGGWGCWDQCVLDFLQLFEIFPHNAASTSVTSGPHFTHLPRPQAFGAPVRRVKAAAHITPSLPRQSAMVASKSGLWYSTSHGQVKCLPKYGFHLPESVKKPKSMPCCKPRCQQIPPV